MDLTLLLVVLASAFVAAVGVPAAFAWTSAWRWSELDAVGKRRVVRVMLGVGGLFAAIAAVVAGILAWASELWWLAGAGSLLVTAALVIWNLRIAAPIAQIHRLGRQLEDPATQEAARHKILDIVKDASNDPVGRSIKLGAATVLSNADYDTDAGRILEALPVEGLDLHERELRALGLLACRIHTRELQSARATLAEVPALDPNGVHAQTFLTLQALLLVHEGKPDDALTLIPTPAADPQAERGRQVVLAHAHAARNDARSMHDCLAWLEKQHGRQSLARVVRPEGPASRYARELLKIDAAPYRS